MKNVKTQQTWISLVLFTCLSLLAIYLTNLEKNPSNTGYYVDVSKSNQGGWMYSIYHSKKLLIKQEYVPALDGKFQFSTEKDAEKAGNKVIERLNKGLTPSLNPMYFKDNKIKLIKVL